MKKNKIIRINHYKLKKIHIIIQKKTSVLKIIQKFIFDVYKVNWINFSACSMILFRFNTK